MEQEVYCPNCGLEFLVLVDDVEGDGDEFRCPVCNSYETECY